ncbi:hypothetical protein HDE_10070 [Halotydeus destructor]|nr:hypothetical protein HDE_10070 [Halotydeus destructor]
MNCCCSSSSGKMDLKDIPSEEEEEYPCQDQDVLECPESQPMATSYKRLRNSFFRDNELPEGPNVLKKKDELLSEREEEPLHRVEPNVQVRRTPSTGWRGVATSLNSKAEVKGKPRAASKVFEMDYNVYSTKKNIAQGLVDIALLTANATQLKYLLSMGPPRGLSAKLTTEMSKFQGAPVAMPSTMNLIDPNSWPYLMYYANLYCIAVSVTLQVFIGILLLMNSRHDLSERKHGRRAECCNNFLLVGIFFITLVNIFIGVFINYDANAYS